MIEYPVIRKIHKKPSRKELVKIIGDLQDLIGTANSRNSDRNPNQMEEVTGYLELAFKLCVDARQFDPPD